MKNFGIYTFWNVPNYGTFMQAYALQKVIANISNNTINVKQIGYLNPKHYNAYYGIIDFSIKYWPINPHFYKKCIQNLKYIHEIKERKKFLEYYNLIPHIEINNEKDLSNISFDAVILGSDIIWDFSINLFGKDKFLFGNNFNAKKIISYAASFGTVKKETPVPDYVKQGLKNLSAISVRDYNSKTIVNQIINKKTYVVADPTFLHDFNKDKNIVKPNKKNYIIVYGSFFNDELCKAAKVYARKNHLKIICLSSLDDNFNWCDETINQDKLTPFEWVGYFKYANLIMTCTYHGLMFGLIFNKKIIFNPTQFILDKAMSLINYLEIKDELIDRKTFFDKINALWNYEAINKKIIQLKQNSVMYLKEALDLHE